MTDIFQEVEEDLRRERLKRAWDRYGIYVILTAVLIVALTAGWRGYEAWSTARARSNGDLFMAALDAADAGVTDEAAQNLMEFADGAPAGYAMLARFRAATEFAEHGNADQAAQILTALSRDAASSLYRDLALVRLAKLQIDAGQPESVAGTVAALAEDTSNPYHHAAQELMGIAAYVRSELEEARRWFGALRDGATTPPDVRERARIMLSLMDQSAPVADDPPAEPAEETN